jgi:hypothetical protein
LKIEESPCGIKFKAKKAFDPEIFSESELSVLHEVFNTFKNHTPDQISRESRPVPEYKIRKMNEIITYEDMAGEMADYVRMWKKERESFIRSIFMGINQNAKKR